MFSEWFSTWVYRLFPVIEIGAFIFLVIVKFMTGHEHGQLGDLILIIKAYRPDKKRMCPFTVALSIMRDPRFMPLGQYREYLPDDMQPCAID